MAVRFAVFLAGLLRARLLAAGRLAAFLVDFFASVRPAADLLVDFLAVDFLAVDFLAVDFLAVDFLAVDFLAVDFLAAPRLEPPVAALAAVLTADTATFGSALAPLTTSLKL